MKRGSGEEDRLMDYLRQISSRQENKEKCRALAHSLNRRGKRQISSQELLAMLFLDFRGQVTVVEMVDSSFELLSPLCIELESSISRSYSIMASLDMDAGNDSSLRYQYRNEIKRFGKTPEHMGSGHLYILPDHKALEGKY